MPSNKWMILSCALAALLANTACAEQEVVAADKPTAAERLSDDARKAIAEINKGELEGPAFKKETVIKLNAIVRRTVDTLKQFDSLGPQLAQARASGDTARIAEINRQYIALEQEAIAARSAFLAEKEGILARDEEHNKIMLATMEQFMVEAPGEIADAIDRTIK